MSARLLAQNREIFAKRTPVDSAGSDLVHTVICYTRRAAPPIVTKLKSRVCVKNGKNYVSNNHGNKSAERLAKALPKQEAGFDHDSSFPDERAAAD
jgi:hypothetical protein